MTQPDPLRQLWDQGSLAKPARLTARDPEVVREGGSLSEGGRLGVIPHQAGPPPPSPDTITRTRSHPSTQPGCALPYAPPETPLAKLGLIYKFQEVFGENTR